MSYVTVGGGRGARGARGSKRTKGFLARRGRLLRTLARPRLLAMTAKRGGSQRVPDAFLRSSRRLVVGFSGGKEAKDPKDSKVPEVFWRDWRRLVDGGGRERRPGAERRIQEKNRYLRFTRRVLLLYCAKFIK